MRYHLFEVFGIELEYMLIDRESFKVNPIVDRLLTAKHGSLTSDVENGVVEWSNELVAHVVELKTNGPRADLEVLDEDFQKNIQEINGLLQGMNSCLLPTAAHPLMIPDKEMKLWEHSYSKVYALYNRIFDCKGHGWSNVQSMHINLPFYDDGEFEKLHAAVRLLLPIIPALSASSPILEGKFTGFLDTRMQVYKTNQKEIPEMTGKVIPERYFSKSEYSKGIFYPINEAIRPYDKEGILDHHFLNSRGAIARFDRNAIEIRVIDIQECPAADLAIAILIIEALKLLVGEELISLDDQKQWHEDELFEILDEVIKNGENARITNRRFLDVFDLQNEATAGELWKKIYALVQDGISARHRKSIEILLEQGSLSSRILREFRKSPTEVHLEKIYRDLADCLQHNKMYKA